MNARQLTVSIQLGLWLAMVGGAIVGMGLPRGAEAQSSLAPLDKGGTEPAIKVPSL
jgi:hypothetical protein